MNNNFCLKLSTNTQQAYLNVIKNYKNYLSSKGINYLDVDEKIIQEYINTMATKYKPATVMIHYAAITKFNEFNSILKIKNKINLPKNNSHEPIKILSKAKIKKLEVAIINQQYKVIFYLLLELGLRRNEVFNITNEEINIEKEIIIVNNNVNKSRILPLNKKIIKALKNYKLPNKSKDRYFDNISHPGLINQYFKKIDKEINPHLLRHTCIANLIKNKVDLATIQAISGHSSIEFLKAYHKPVIADLRVILK